MHGVCLFPEVTGEDIDTIVGHNPLSMLHHIQTPYSRGITYCTMMEEHVSFPGRDTLTGLLVEFTVKAGVHTAKDIHLIESI